MPTKISGLSGSLGAPALDAGRPAANARDATTGGGSSAPDGSSSGTSDVHITDSASQLASLEQTLRSLPAVDERARIAAPARPSIRAPTPCSRSRSPTNSSSSSTRSASFPVDYRVDPGVCREHLTTLLREESAAARRARGAPASASPASSRLPTSRPWRRRPAPDRSGWVRSPESRSSAARFARCMASPRIAPAWKA